MVSGPVEEYLSKVVPQNSRNTFANPEIVRVDCQELRNRHRPDRLSLVPKPYSVCI